MGVHDVKSSEITEDEAALYDRQIRLWGLDAQKRLRAARVLLVGLSGLGAEVAKNIVLSGVKSLTLLDHTSVTEEDSCYQFLISRDDIGKNRAESSLQRAQLLNPMVQVSADTGDVTTKDEAYLRNYDVICCTCCSVDEIMRINEICHRNDVMFYAGDVFGFYSFMFADLNNHEFAEEVQKAKKVDHGDGEPAVKRAKVEMEAVPTKNKCSFTRFEDSLNIDWSVDDYKKRIKRMPKTYFLIRVLHEFRKRLGRDPSTSSLEEDTGTLLRLREEVMTSLNASLDLVPEDFTQYCFAELSPVCAVAGGILGQEIIKAVSKKDRPHNNFFFYNGVSGEGMVDCIC